MNNLPTKHIGFTLAEVLITLGVIGVVSAITIPALIQNYQKQVTVNQLKKVYSEITQAVKKAEIEHGLMQTWDFSNFETQLEMDKYFAENYLFPNIKVMRSCFPSSNDCWAEKVYRLSGEELPYGTQYANGIEKASSFVTVSGYSVYFWLGAGRNAVFFAIDLNGYKKAPNKLGRDIFVFHSYFNNWEDIKTGIYPAGAEYKTLPKREDYINGSEIIPAFTTCNKNGDGEYCSGLIAIDGWKISDDYPW